MSRHNRAMSIMGGKPDAWLLFSVLEKLLEGYRPGGLDYDAVMEARHS